MRNKEKGISLIETMFVIALISILAYLSSAVFYNQNKKETYYASLNKLQNRAFYISQYFKNQIKNSSGFIYQNNILTIKSPEKHCMNQQSTNDIYTFKNNKIYCNGQTFLDNIPLFDLKIGIAKDNESSITHYVSDYDGTQYAKYIFIEFYLNSEKTFFDNKEYKISSFQNVQNITSNSIIEGFRNGFFTN